MIFHQQDAQWFGCFAGEASGPTPVCRSWRQSVECHLECCAEASPAALCLDFSMVKIDEPFGNCQAEPESAELPADRTISLLEGPKQGRQSLRFNSDSCVGNFEMKTGLLIIKRADGDFSILRGEFHRVVNQIPKHLLKPYAVREDVVLLCFKLR